MISLFNVKPLLTVFVSEQSVRSYSEDKGSTEAGESSEEQYIVSAEDTENYGKIYKNINRSTK
ncbi:MAG: hypothetical protein JST55_11325 [Bacteroidetes bacterium]|nr:hypothetical protein [Bacteroidota bacterium]